MDTPLIKRAYNLGLKTVANFESLSEEQIAYYEAHLDQIPEALARGFVILEKFVLLVDLGIITVPKGYVHGTRLATFKKQNQKKFYGYNDAISDENFPNPSHILKPGDKLHVQAFKQIVPGQTTSAERMAFLATQKAVHVGAQGASLVFELKRDELPKGKWYASFDEEDRLWRDAGGYRRVPIVRACSGGGFGFGLGNFGDPWNDGNVLLCFRDLEKSLDA